MASFRDDELVVNFHDAVINGSDLALLQSNTAWLNDACIHFYFTYLQRQQRVSQQLPVTTFLDPSVVSFFMHQCTDEDDMEDFKQGFEPCRIERPQRIFVPINDAMAATSTTWMRGMHWSLLVIERDDADEFRFYHFDSSPSCGNDLAASNVARKIACELFGLAEANVRVHECPTPRQTNGYDCGVHVLIVADVVSTLDAEGTSNRYETALREHFDKHPTAARDMRGSIIRIILRLAEENRK